MFNVFRVSDLKVIQRFRTYEEAKHFLNCLKDKEECDIAEVGRFKKSKEKK